MNKESKFGLLSDNFKGYIVRLALFALFRCLLVIGLAAWFLRSDLILNGSLPAVTFPIEIIFTGAAIYMFIEAVIFINMYQDAKPVSDKNTDEMTIGSFVREVSKASAYNFFRSRLHGFGTIRVAPAG